MRRGFTGESAYCAGHVLSSLKMTAFCSDKAYLCGMQEILASLGIKTLNDMQLAAIAAGKTPQDVVLLSDTGSGKTLAFLLPLLERLQTDISTTQALVITPTRELAQQIEKVFRSLRTGFKVTSCYGGHLRETEENALKEAPALIIGTPGRLGDHIRRGNINTGGITTLVMDEFDKSFELGFREEIAFVLASLPAVQKRMLTSATEAAEIPDFIQLQDPVTLNFLSGETSAALTIKTLQSDEKDKADTLFRLICMLGNRPTIVFCNHRDAVERTSELLSDKGITTVFYHGALEQADRDVALCKFRNGTSNVLVTTDLASRGLDIPNIRYIIHYHLPVNEETFIHRNGRTARMDASGTAIVITGPEETLPPYIPADAENITLPATATLPDKPQWSTLYISAGKKDKVNKVDIVGFFTNKGGLKKEDLGLIEVKDFIAFAAVRKSKVSQVLQLIKNEKVKNKKVRIEVAK